MDVKIIFGSTTGNTESAANAIAGEFDGAQVLNVSCADKTDIENADLLILGSSTWGIGDIQDDWDGGLDLLDSPALNGKKVAIFGLGDQTGFGDSYLDAVGILYDKVVSAGAEVIGKWSTEGYDHTGSTAERDGVFVGLALDDDNESHLTAERISAWCVQLKEQVA